MTCAVMHVATYRSQCFATCLSIRSSLRRRALTCAPAAGAAGTCGHQMTMSATSRLLMDSQSQWPRTCWAAGAAGHLLRKLRAELCAVESHDRMQAPIPRGPSLRVGTLANRQRCLHMHAMQACWALLRVLPCRTALHARAASLQGWQGLSRASPTHSGRQMAPGDWPDWAEHWYQALGRVGQGGWPD